MKNIIIIGGGASGYMAAISAALKIKELRKENEVKITILERCDKTGRKILATGNGRCNLTNMNMGKQFYNGADIEIVDKIINKFNVENTLQLFKEMGLMVKIETDGNVYPYSLQASSVLDVLRNKAADLKVVERCSFEVSSIIRTNNKFIVKSKTGETVNADILIIAAGGCSAKNLGSNGSGHILLNSLGHKISDVFPAITQIRTEQEIVKSIQGNKVTGKFTLKIGNKTVYEDMGEILFTEYGISGPIAFKTARIVGKAIRENTKEQINAVIDLLPDMEYNKLVSLLSRRINIFEGKTIERFMTGFINKRIGQAVIKVSGFNLADNISVLNLKNIDLLAKTLKNFTFRCIGTQDFQSSQVTAGGALLSEFNPETLESSLIPGLFVCGEVLDVDGECGGYNLQWAWSSGYTTGMAAAMK